MEPRRRWRLRLEDLFVKRCPREAPLCLSLPDAVLRKRFATAFFVFILGMVHSPPKVFLFDQCIFLHGAGKNVQQFFLEKLGTHSGQTAFLDNFHQILAVFVL